MSAPKTATDAMAFAIPQDRFGRDAAATALRTRAVYAECIMLMRISTCRKLAPCTPHAQTPPAKKTVAFEKLTRLRHVRLAALRQDYSDFRAPGRAAFHNPILQRESLLLAHLGRDGRVWARRVSGVLPPRPALRALHVAY
jgi:hypothetical protein